MILRVKFPVDYIKLITIFFGWWSILFVNVFICDESPIHYGPWPSTAVFATDTGGGGAGGVARGKGGGGGAGLDTFRLR